LTPLAIPLLAGPGAIATTLVFACQADSPINTAILSAGAALVFTASYLCLYRADDLARLIGHFGIKIVTRIMGLLLAFIAVQYITDGIRALF
jgi:multiple antibiotic resistance protein